MLDDPEDVAHRKMRTYGMPGSIQWEAIGQWDGEPIRAPYAEVYELLQKGIIDGAIHSPYDYEVMKFYEVAPYFCVDYAFAELEGLCINSDVWNSLQAEERQVIADAALDYASEMLDTVKGTDADALQWIQDYGVTVNTLTPEERAVWREASRPIWEDWLDEVGTQLGQQIIDIALAHNPLPDVLSIGCLAPITGPAAGKGEPMFHGEQDYFRYVNRSGGIGDYAVYATFYDDEYNDTLASQYYEEAVADGALVVTAMSSKITAALCCLYDADGMPFLHAFSAPFCLHPPGHAYATLPTYGDGLAAFMQWLESTGGTPCTLALYGLNNPTGEGASDAARALAESLDIEVVGYWDHPSDLDDVEAKATLLEIMEAAEGSPFWLFVSSTPGPSATIAMAAVDPEVALPAGICLGHASALPAFVDLAGSAAEGVYGMQSPVFWGASVPAMPALTQYCQTYHPGDVGNPDYMLGWQLGMCAAESLKNAVIQSGGEALTPQIVEANGVRQVSFDAGGLTGWVDWMDDYDRRGAKSINLALVQGGQWEVLAPWIEAPLIHYEDYSWFDPIECP